MQKIECHDAGDASHKQKIRNHLTMPLLNQRHESFAQLIASGGSGAGAYRTCYGTNGASAEAAASRLLRNVKVRERVTELQSAAATAAVLTLERKRQILADIAEGRQQQAKISDRLHAIELDAKLAGEFHEKLDVNWRRQQTEHPPIIYNIPAAISQPRISGVSSNPNEATDASP